MRDVTAEVGGNSVTGGFGNGPQRVLVTGGAGYIGSHVVQKLLARGHAVQVVDNYLYGGQGLIDLFNHPRLEMIEGDIRSRETMRSAVRGANRVIALAALVGDAACELDVNRTISINQEATQLLAEVCREEGVQRVVFASSCSVYGANSNGMLDETSWLNPVSVYAKTRIRSEEILLEQIDRFSVTVLRLATVFGLSSRMRLDLLVNTFTANGFFDGKIRVFGGQQYRPNLHVQDAAEAFILAAMAPDEKVRGETFNVGDESLNYTVLEIAKLVQGEMPHVEVEIAEGESDQRNYRVKFDRIREVLGFRTRFAVEDGIREMMHAFRDWAVLAPAGEWYHNFRYLKTRGFPQVMSEVAAHPAVD